MLAVTIEPTLKNSKKENACLTPLDSAASIMMMLLAAPNIVRFPVIVLAAASIIYWEVSSAIKPFSNITEIYRATNGTLLSI